MTEIDDLEIVRPIFFRRTLWRVCIYSLLMGLYAAIPAIKESTEYAVYGDSPAEIHAAFSVVLGWLLVFRTNAAYARWWEARTLWGELVNVSRNVAVKVTSLGRVDAKDLREVQTLIIGFAPLLRDHLRKELPGSTSDRLIPDSPRLTHAPSDVVQRLYAMFNHWKADQRIDGDELRVIDEDAHRFLHVCGGCERIRSTRIVRSYRIFARQCVFLFLVTFPWGIADDFHWWTIPLTIMTSYFMLGLETVAEHVEEPFGYDEDDLDLDGICDTIARSVSQIFEQRLKQV